MPTIFEFKDEQCVGYANSVNTTRVYVHIADLKRLKLARVGRLVAMQGQDANEHIIGIVEKIWRDYEPQAISGQQSDSPEVPQPGIERNGLQVILVGTYRKQVGVKTNGFTRAVLSLPDISRDVFVVEHQNLENLMSIISGEADKTSLELGTYSLDKSAKAFLNANKLFQRHAALLGSTGSGKSWVVATILEQIAKLDNPNVILFDIHGEYSELPYADKLRIANPEDIGKSSTDALYVPYWLLSYEEMRSIFTEGNDSTSINQTSVIVETMMSLKKEYLIEKGHNEIAELFTVDSPVPYSLDRFVEKIHEKDVEKVEGSSGKPVKGPLNGKLTRLVLRLKTKSEDRRYGFLFSPPETHMDYDYMYEMILRLLGHGDTEGDRAASRGVKVIDFSDVPSDILPIVAGIIARIVFEIQFWSEWEAGESSRHPIVLVCDEAHLYVPKKGDSSISAVESRALENFERISKEGRKYGVGLFVVSQRPSDVSSTVLSQCNNVISLRLTNSKDRSAVQALMPDSLGGLLEVLPALEIGEAIVVGDSTLLPTRIQVNEPEHKPKSSTIDFWDVWASNNQGVDLKRAIEQLRRQGRFRDDSKK